MNNARLFSSLGAILLLSFIPVVQAQEPVTLDTVITVDPVVEMERALEDATQDADDSQLVDVLARLAEEPLDLNSATVEELQQIPEITPMMALNIVNFRQGRPLRSVDEILIIEGFTPDILARIRPFVRVVPDIPASFHVEHPTGSLRSRTSQDLQRRRGFVEGIYHGSPVKLYNRMLIKSGNIELLSLPPFSAALGVLTEKDAGERKLNDFTAASLDVRIKSLNSRVIAGDYIIEAAEGMVFWRGIGFSKGSNVLSGVRKSGTGIRPYLSTDENLYFRGIGVQSSVDAFTGTIVYSNKPLSASLNAEGVVTSLYSAGLFRTASEEARRNTTREQLLGGRIVFQPERSLTLGISGYRASFHHPVVLKSGQLRIGTSTHVGGFDVTYIQRRYTFFSEAALDERNHIAGVGGILYQPVASLALTLVGRWYPRDFVSLHGYGFGESGGPPQNESGLYLGLRWRIASWWILSTYFDQFLFPQYSSSILLPSSGYDLLTFSEFRLIRRLVLEAQFKRKRKDILVNTLDALGRSKREIGMRTQENYRLTVSYTPSITFRWRSRVELVRVDLPTDGRKEQGILLFQDVRMSPFPLLLLNARVIMFDTDSFESRVYEFETDLPGTFSNPALFGKGIRWYIVGRYEVARWLDVSLKYAHTLKDRTKKISFGANEIAGGIDNRLSIQVDMLF